MIATLLFLPQLTPNLHLLSFPFSHFATVIIFSLDLDQQNTTPYRHSELLYYKH